jgi:hypothetical protein
MSLHMLVLVVVNTLLPLLALWWLIAPQRGSRLEWLAKVVLVLAYLACVALASVWLMPSVCAPQACFVPFAIALGLSWLTARASTSVDPESRPTTALSRPSTGRFATSA